jgi:hypothetical protein
MSNLSTEVFGDMNYLYEHIANRDVQQLNENSDYYDEEFTELVENIFYNISYSMASEGYSANGILDFLSKSPEEEIIEKYFDCTISEGLVSEEYILEQLEIIDEGIGSALKILGKGIGMGAKALARNTGTALKGAGRTVSVATQRAIGPGARKTIKGAVAKVKDIAKSAKGALTSPTAKKVALGAAALGAATGAGYLGGRMSGSGGQGPSPLIAKPSEQAPTTPPKAPEESKPPSNNSSGGSPSGGNGAPSKGGGASSNTPKKPTFTKQTGNPEKDMKTWAAANPKLAAAQAERDRTRGTQQSDNPQLKDLKSNLPMNSPSVQSPEVSKLGKGNQSLADNPDAFKAATPPAPKESDKKSDKKSETNESYDAYDLVLEYLFDNGHADTLAEAEYLMTELDESFIQSLVETYNANLLAEEVTEWVNELVEEGYDLSEYTWDDMVDYYFTEARVDAGKTDDEKRTARSERGTVGYMHPFTRNYKKRKGAKPLSSPGKYSQMQHDKTQAQRERDADEQRRRDRGAMGRGTWDKD